MPFDVAKADLARLTLEPLLEALDQSGTSDDPLVTEEVAGVAGAVIIRNVLSAAECAPLERFVCELHGRELAAMVEEAGGVPKERRRDSQHHLAVRVEKPALKALCERLRPALPQAAGPEGDAAQCPLSPAGDELSAFLRTYCYQPGDFSTPHFDRYGLTTQPAAPPASRRRPGLDASLVPVPSCRVITPPLPPSRACGCARRRSSFCETGPDGARLSVFTAYSFLL
jgi:hypothetical protein